VSQGHAFDLSLERSGGRVGNVVASVTFIKDGQPTWEITNRLDAVLGPGGSQGIRSFSLIAGDPAGTSVGRIPVTGAPLAHEDATLLIELNPPFFSCSQRSLLFEPAWLNRLIVPVFWWWNRRWIQR
jgi:hypothetical protein